MGWLDGAANLIVHNPPIHCMWKLNKIKIDIGIHDTHLTLLNDEPTDWEHISIILNVNSFWTLQMHSLLASCKHIDTMLSRNSLFQGSLQYEEVQF